MLKTSIALAVAAVPEGLAPMATTALALGIEEMRRRQVLVRRLDAVETLAAVDVICFDKTGTLTENRMSAVAVACGGTRYAAEAATAPAFRRLLEVAALCNEAALSEAAGVPTVSGTPTEAALLRLALDAGVDVAALRRAFPLRATEYRSDGRHYMVTAHERPHGGRLLAVKGNPEQVLACCGAERRGGRRVRLSNGARQACLDANRRMAAEGLRVLGFACAEGGAAAASIESVAALVGRRGFTWLGLVGLADPARQGAGELLARLDRAGIRVLMLTGDQEATARAVAEGLNLGNGAPVATLAAGALDAAEDDAIGALAERAHVFARVTPADKLRIVRALQSAGRVVAMTGDGINDGPALSAADVGIVMGRAGSEAARAVADIVLAGDDLEAIVAALERGRTTYGNIRKAIRFLLATNLSEMLVMLAATAAGIGGSLTPLQLLWINLLSDVLPALGLALEPAEKGVLDAPPRDAAEAILRRRDLGALAREGGIIAAGALAAYCCGALRHGASPRAGTISFTSLVGAQLFHALTCRSAAHGLFCGERLPANRPLGLTLAASAGLQGAVLLVPALRRFMGLERLDMTDALMSLAGALLPYVANEASKALGSGKMAARSQRRRSSE
jgi:Ca2+-transporting ATPase